MRSFALALLLVVLMTPCAGSTWLKRNTRIPQRTCTDGKRSLLKIRGGSDIESNNNDNDEERYSRQVYTLGARAHGLIRSSTVYLDGPPSSGLLYECAKNLALSGVRNIVIVIGESNESINYLDPSLDDLGQAYQRAARAEVKENADDDVDLLVKFLQQLNPNISVSFVDRSELKGDTSDDENPVVYLCIDRPYSIQTELNHLARNYRWKFVSTETAGVFGRIFCDFGSTFHVFDADGETPLNTPLDHIEQRDDGSIIVHCFEGEKHDVSKGDHVQFLYRSGESSDIKFVVTDVQTPYRFVAEVKLDSNSHSSIDGFVSEVNENASNFRRIKIPREITFKSFKDVIESAKSDESLFAACDLDKSFDSSRRNACMSCFQALSEFTKQNNKPPTLQHEDEFMQLVKESWNGIDITNLDKTTKNICLSFLRTCSAKFVPFQAVFGAIAAQEAMKAITGLYFPIRQLLLYDVEEVLQSKHEANSPTSCVNPMAAPGLRHILGDKIVNKLQKKKVFLVGSGAIGCEIIKNLAAMGSATRKRGKLILTDMDTIEKSNLSRQLLFRDNDIGKFKSTAAREAAIRYNTMMNIEAHSSKVGASDEHTPFDETFWSDEVDVVLNALDNVEARLFMDGQCVSNKKALVDAGTLGPKGNVQVVVPDQSESYASSVDPPEPAIPVCTLKNFPYAISHTIQWARDLFDDLFERRPEQANNMAEKMQSHKHNEIILDLLRDNGEEAAVNIASELTEDLTGENTSLEYDLAMVRENSLKWAVKLVYKLYYRASVHLLTEHPLNSVDEDGEPFWSGTRRPPRMLYFDPKPLDADQVTINNNIISFVRNCARLRVESILGDQCEAKDCIFDEEEIEKACHALGKNDDSLSLSDDSCLQTDQDIPVREKVTSLLNKVQVGPRKLSAVEFEKDDESNGHVAFVTAASNLRAIVYGIPPVDAMETRRVAGNIVPAMITTTAFVSALSCIEFVKLVQNADLKMHRNAFINLALPFFAFTVPLPAEEMPGLDGKTYTLWDRLKIKESEKTANAGGMRVKSLLKKIRKKIADDPSRIAVASISCGPYMLYANFLHEDDKEVLNTTIWDLVDDAVNSTDTFDMEHSRDGDIEEMSDYIHHDGFVDLAVVVEDTETGEEIELPTIRVERFIKVVSNE